MFNESGHQPDPQHPREGQVHFVSLIHRPIPSFSMLHAETLKSWEWAWRQG